MLIAVGAFAAQRLIASRQLHEERAPVIPVDVVDFLGVRRPSRRSARLTSAPRPCALRGRPGRRAIGARRGWAHPRQEAILEIDPRDFSHRPPPRRRRGRRGGPSRARQRRRGGEGRSCSRRAPSRARTRSPGPARAVPAPPRIGRQLRAARLDEARLDLERTRILAPFRARPRRASRSAPPSTAPTGGLVNAAVFSIVSVPGRGSPDWVRGAATVHLRTGLRRAGRFAGPRSTRGPHGAAARGGGSPAGRRGAELRLLGAARRLPWSPSAAIPRSAPRRRRRLARRTRSSSSRSARRRRAAPRRRRARRGGLRDEAVISTIWSVPGARVRPTGDAGSARCGWAGESGQ